MRQIVRLADGWGKQWDRYVYAHPHGWFWHMDGWLHYLAMRRSDALDLSFLIVDEAQQVLAVCPLILEDGAFQAQGDPLPGPLWPMTNGDIWQAIEEHIYNTAVKYGAKCARYMAGPLALPYPAGLWTRWKAVGWQSRIVRLKPDEPDPLNAARPSYRALARQAFRRYAVREVSQMADGVNGLRIADGRPAFHPCWEWWLQRGWAHCWLATAGSEPIGYMYCHVYKQTAYYSSGIYRRRRGEAHAMMAIALRRLRQLGITTVELGWQGHAQTERERGIEFFKRGWGGTDEPVAAVERTF